MNLAALQHLAKAASALADDCRLVVIGTVSLPSSFPDLGREGGPPEQTFDAELCPESFNESTGLMLNQGLGESKAFHLLHGFHADIVRPTLIETLPQGRQQRLVPLPGVEMRWRCTQQNPSHPVSAPRLGPTRLGPLESKVLAASRQATHAIISSNGSGVGGLACSRSHFIGVIS